MLRASVIAATMAFSQVEAGTRRVQFHLTTSGAVTTPEALQLLTHPDLRIAVSCDGPPALHDLLSSGGGADGAPSYPAAVATINRLIAAG